MPLLDYEARLKRTVNRCLKHDDISEENKNMFEDFLRYLRLQDYSPAHIEKLLSHLKMVMEHVDFSLKGAGKEKIEDIVAWVHSRDISDATKRQYKIVLKVVYKWLNDGRYPDKVNWITTTQKRNKTVLPQKLLTEEDIKELLNAADNPRDRALISLLWESGARIGELKDLKIGDFEDGKHGLKVVIKGKTGPRRLPLISCVPHLQSWFSSHPRMGEDGAPVWVNLGTTNHGKESEYRTLLKALNKTAKNAGINKPVNPHHFRHSRATYMASRFTEAQMCEWFGWVQGSNQPARYVHMSGRDIDADYARMHGIEEEENPEESTLAPKECPRCGNSVPPDGEFCYKCGMALSLEAAQQIEKDEEEISRIFTEEAQKDPEMLKDMQDFVVMLKMIRSDSELREDFHNLFRELKRSG